MQLYSPVDHPEQSVDENDDSSEYKCIFDTPRMVEKKIIAHHQSRRLKNIEMARYTI